MTDRFKSMDTSPGYRGALIAFGILVVVWVGWLFYADRQEKKAEATLADMVHAAPQIAAADIDKYSGTGKLVAFTMLTNDIDKFGQMHKQPGKPTPKALAFRELRTWTVYHSRTGDTNEWQNAGQDPPEMKLISADHKISVWVDTLDLERGLLPTIFEAHTLDEFDFVLPDEWQKKALRKHSLKTAYRIIGLPCNARVYVLGVISKAADGYHVGGFDCRGWHSPAMVTLEAGQKYAGQEGMVEH